MAVTQHEEQTHERERPGPTPGGAADRLARSLPGYRVEILRGRLIATPWADVSHALTLSWLGEEFGARARTVGLRLVQGVGLWLPSGPEDYAIPDLSVVEADIKDAHVMKNCYAAHVFRMVVEVTSTNWADDLGPKVEDYAQAGIPVYVVADRKHDRVLLCTDPRGGEYKNKVHHGRGTSFTVPEVAGVEMKLSVDRLLDGDED
ncbi:Uma2 family endonuclease [Streptomyces sp. sk2.1]|uniref:Uma2 family endonuclease n=1 Tax=Streptomyces sp. sk2.1 TaxID=2478959 RepID=UPI0011E74EFC|nr:Uma2 family endonuclease [Streptomyces sp. sk2.1]TXS66913.1 Uma2 family endonuclease [Streptomyces sp. sk2.1]